REVRLTESGPGLAARLRGRDERARISALDRTQRTDFVLENSRLVREQLSADTPLIGFAGAPFTVATYAIEGKTAKTFTETKKLFYRQPEIARRLLALLAESTRDYLLAQVAAGAQAIQIFDSWVGIVSPDDWDRYVFEP